MWALGREYKMNINNNKSRRQQLNNHINIDFKISNLFNKQSFNKQSFNKQSKLLLNNINNNDIKINNIKYNNKSLIGATPIGATPKLQSQWKAFNHQKRNILRNRYKDSDGDRIPNKWDCSPNNVMKQDFKIDEEQYDFKNKKFKYDDTRKVIMMPVEELYHKRGRYTLNDTAHIYESYKEDAKIEDNIVKASGKGIYHFPSDVAIKHRVKNVESDLKNQGFITSKPVKNKSEYSTDYSIKYRRPAKKYKEEIDMIMSPTNTDSERSNNLGDNISAAGGSNKEAGKAERIFHITNMRDAVMRDSAEVPMITIYGTDFKPGATIGEGRHRILAAKYAGLKEMPVFVEPNNRLPKGALDKYRELTPDEIQQYSDKTRIKKQDVKQQDVEQQEIKYYDNTSTGYKSTPNYDIGYDDYKDKRTPEEIEQENELQLLLLRDEYLNS